MQVGIVGILERSLFTPTRGTSSIMLRYRLQRARHCSELRRLLLEIAVSQLSKKKKYIWARWKARQLARSEVRLYQYGDVRSIRWDDVRDVSHCCSTFGR